MAAPPTQLVPRAPQTVEYFQTRPSFMLRRAMQIADRFFEERTGDADITQPQVEVLSAIEALPGADQIGLSLALGIDDSTITVILSSLARRGLIQRKVSDKDRRRRCPVLTPAAESALPGLQRAAFEADQDLLAPLPAAKARELIDGLATIASRQGSLAPAWSPPSKRTDPELSKWFKRPSFLTRRAGQTFNALYLESTKSAGLTQRQYAILFLIDLDLARDQADIARAIQVDRSAIAMILQALLDMGAITRTADPGDKRRQILQITKEGRKLRRAVQPLSEAAERQLTSTLGVAGARTHLQLLRALMAAHRSRIALPEDLISLE